MITHYWYLKDICYQYDCNGCNDLSMMVYHLNNFMSLKIKGVDFRFYVFNMSKNDEMKLLNNSVLNHLEVLK